MFSLQKIAALACLTSLTLGSVVVLNFDDLSVSNEDSCGSTLLGNEESDTYHGFFVSGSASGGPDSDGETLPVLNTTKTAACSGVVTIDQTVSDFGFASSLPNVAMSPYGNAEFQIVKGFFFGDVTLSIGLNLRPEDITFNSTISVDFQLTNFNDAFDVIHDFPAANGAGPFKITVPNPNNMSLFQFSISTANNYPVKDGVQLTPIYLDDITFNVSD